MLRFVGCDVHKRTAVFTILLEDGTLFASYTVPVTREALTVFAERQLKKEDRLAMEATTNTWAVAGVLRPFVAEVVIGNPLRVRAIAEAKIKTDKVDSRVLAELLRCEYLPVVWQPDADTQRLRRLTHRRAALVSDRTRLKNRLHSILHHTLVPLPEFDLFSKRGIVWLRELPLAEEEAQARDSDLRLLEQTELEIAELEKRLVREAWQDEKVRLVMSIPGIDYTVAQTCLAAIGDIARFPNAKKLAAYLISTGLFWGRGLKRRPLPQTPTLARRCKDVEMKSETVPKVFVTLWGVTSKVENKSRTEPSKYPQKP
jgi:transposase